MNKCSVEHCNKKHHARGYCMTHAARFYRLGTVELPPNSRNKKFTEKCKIANCDNSYFAKGVCSKHYSRKIHSNSTDLTVELHNMTNTSEYYIWSMMKQRCHNPNCTNYKNYGARGIRVCDIWLNSFIAFYKDMGARPSKDHSIDRIDNNGNYEPSNCRWATREQQANNRRPKYLAIA